jgi:glucose-6-phosphate dehydrogenase assembly protein OpcA
MAPAHTHVDEWAGSDVRVRDIEEALAELRRQAEEDGVPDLRTSVMTHLAWVPDEWVEAATETLAGLAERHPSRAILLLPDPEADEDRLDAAVFHQCFSIVGQERHVCAEVIRLRLCGRRALAPASIVTPLLIADLPVFIRWRGKPPFDRDEFRQLIDVTDRLVIDSSEWPGLPAAYGELEPVFGRAAVSDIAWARTLPWRAALARRWPGIAELQKLRVRGPHADALLLAGWLRGRLVRDVALEHEEAEELESIAVDGEEVPAPPGERPTPSDLLSDELDRFSRDLVYEESVTKARTGAV